MNRTDDELMQAMARDDFDALEELYRRHVTNLVRFACRWRETVRDAEDIAQETFLKIWENRHRYVERQRFKPWMLRICLNLCYDRLRRRETVRAALDEQEAHEPTAEGFEETVIEKDEAAFVRKHVDSLPEEDRIMLNLRLDAELTAAETAEVLGCSIRTVHYRMAGILEKLRRQMGVTV